LAPSPLVPTNGSGLSIVSAIAEKSIVSAIAQQLAQPGKEKPPQASRAENHASSTARQLLFKPRHTRKGQFE
jgi:hypothetical protein